MNICRQKAIESLQCAGIRPSEPRLCIYEYLDGHRIHPRAEEIYSALAPEHPTLSLTTVYNTLKLFAEHRLIRVLNIDSSEQRYDINTDFHAHLKCRTCGSVTDIFMPAPSIPAANIEQISLDCYGLCSSCAAQAD